MFSNTVISVLNLADKFNKALMDTTVKVFGIFGNLNPIVKGIFSILTLIIIGLVILYVAQKEVADYTHDVEEDDINLLTNVTRVQISSARSKANRNLVFNNVKRLVTEAVIEIPLLIILIKLYMVFVGHPYLAILAVALTIVVAHGECFKTVKAGHGEGKRVAWLILRKNATKIILVLTLAII